MITVAGIELSPGEYILRVGEDQSYSIRPITTEDTKNILEKIWLKDAPFTYQDFLETMKSKGYIIEGRWKLFQTRGNKKTSAFTVRGCYEQLLYLKCLPILSLEKIKVAFNDIGADIKTAKTLECACGAENDMFDNLFQCSEHLMEH